MPPIRTKDLTRSINQPAVQAHGLLSPPKTPAKRVTSLDTDSASTATLSVARTEASSPSSLPSTISHPNGNVVLDAKASTPLLGSSSPAKSSRSPSQPSGDSGLESSVPVPHSASAGASWKRSRITTRSMVRFPASESDCNSSSGKVAFVFHPANFAASGNRNPQRGDVLSFELRFPDNIPILFDDPTDDDGSQKEVRPAADASRSEFKDRMNEPGVALLDETGLFMGWVVHKDTHIIRPKLRAGHSVTGRVIEVRTFLWNGYSESGLCTFIDHSI